MGLRSSKPSSSPCCAGDDAENSDRCTCMEVNESDDSGIEEGALGDQKKRAKKQSKSNHSCPIHTASVARKIVISPFVLKRWSSQFVDEDGDVAHEFYEEVQSGKGRRLTCVRILSKIRPQGLVRYSIPRLNAKLPYIMVDAKT